MSAVAFDHERLLDRSFPELTHRYGWKDTALYALGVGLGADPLDSRQLRYVYEEDMQALPMMAVVLAYPGFWAKEADTGIAWQKVLHGEQGLTIHRPIPAEGTVIGRTRITSILDKGADKGALLYSTRSIRDAESGDLYAEVHSTSFLRGNGGFGGPSGPQPQPHAIPDRVPDLSVDLPTLPQAALIYRLSGDFNPLHADPAVATGAGFKAPILHGLCTYGVAGHALIRALMNYDGRRLRSLDCRFSSPVYPGETIRTEIWRGEERGEAFFRARVVERDQVVLNNGRVLYD